MRLTYLEFMHLSRAALLAADRRRAWSTATRLGEEARVSEPGLLVVDVAAADDATAFASQQLLAGRGQWRKRSERRWMRGSAAPRTADSCARTSPPAISCCC
ncbi:DUF6207 family protein [Spirillospora sp. CA-128828]|uniref:DUF6207 family protein n=1 Tax=Spirillospora sp. CA-128828 TaxID=3240033 RepID=UPI003D94473B